MSKNFSDKFSQILNDYAKQPSTDPLKTTSKRSIKKQQKQLVTLLVIKLQMKLQGLPQKVFPRLLYKQMKN